MGLFETLLTRLRVLTSEGKNAPMQILFEENVITILVDLLQDVCLGHNSIVSETLWIMINVLASPIEHEKIEFIRQSEFPKRLVKIMDIDCPDILENVTFIFNLLVGNLVLL